MLLVRRSGSSLAAVLGRRRAMGTVAKGTARAAVHGSRSPTNTAVEEEAEAAIEKGKEEKRKMRERVEAKVDDAHQIGGSSSSAPPRSK